MNGIDTLNQAAQALRDTKPELAAALEAMAAQKSLAYLTRNEDGDPAMLFFDREEACTYCSDSDPEPLYAAPIATPEHDAKVWDMALEEAIKACNDESEEEGEAIVTHVCGHLVKRLRALKSTGANHAK